MKKARENTGKRSATVKGVRLPELLLLSISSEAPLQSL